VTKTSGRRSLLRLSELGVDEFTALLTAARGFAAPDRLGPTGVGEAPAVAFVSERRSVRTRVATLMAAGFVGRQFVDLPWEMFYADPKRRPDHDSFFTNELRSLVDLGCGCLVARVLNHELLQLWDSAGVMPIVNGCSDVEHPLQALADALTLSQEFADLGKVNLAFVGNGASPVLASLLAVAGYTGMETRVVTPAGYAPGDRGTSGCGQETRYSWLSDIAEGLSGADVVYADEPFYRAPTDEEKRDFSPYQLTGALLDRCCPSARVMHCLPHSDEVDSSVLERPGSLVREQVRNRPSVTAAVLARALSE
jgi:ornithine carbamoyltransferase